MTEGGLEQCAKMKRDHPAGPTGRLRVFGWGISRVGVLPQLDFPQRVNTSKGLDLANTRSADYNCQKWRTEKARTRSFRLHGMENDVQDRWPGRSLRAHRVSVEDGSTGISAPTAAPAQSRSPVHCRDQAPAPAPRKSTPLRPRRRAVTRGPDSPALRRTKAGH